MRKESHGPKEGLNHIARKEVEGEGREGRGGEGKGRKERGRRGDGSGREGGKGEKGRGRESKGRRKENMPMVIDNLLSALHRNVKPCLFSSTTKNKGIIIQPWR